VIARKMGNIETGKSGFSELPRKDPAPIKSVKTHPRRQSMCPLEL